MVGRARKVQGVQSENGLVVDFEFQLGMSEKDLQAEMGTLLAKRGRFAEQLSGSLKP